MNKIVPNILLVVCPSIVTWFLARREKIATARSTEIEAEVRAAEFYKALLDDAMERMNKAILTIKEQDEKIKTLLFEVEQLTDELRKYKQLNGKRNDKVCNNSRSESVGCSRNP